MILEHPDSIVINILDSLKEFNVDMADDLVKKGMRLFPMDNRFYILSATISQARNSPQDAFTNIWSALAIEPQSQLARSELLHIIISDFFSPLQTDKDFSLYSGERQTGENLTQIRFDHKARYIFASQWIRRKFGVETRAKVGLDVFCGNGYGSRMVADIAGTRMIGLDGSAEAISFAENVYSSHRVVFGQALYPFEVNFPFFDFAISFESIEHVDDPAGLLKQISISAKGPIAISFPDDSGLPFDKYGQFFKHHVRHFRREEIISLLSSLGRNNILAERGQNVYRIENDTIVGLLPEEDMSLRSHMDETQFRILILE